MPCTRLLLTDGNEASVDGIQRNIQLNERHFRSSHVDCATIVWSTEFESVEKYDIVICADCLFFTECHESLLHTIDRLLGPQVG